MQVRGVAQVQCGQSPQFAVKYYPIIREFLEYWTMDKVQKSINSECYTPSSEPIRIYYPIMFYFYIVSRSSGGRPKRRPSPSLRRIHLLYSFLAIAAARMLTPTNDKNENTVTSTHCNEPWPTTPWNPLLYYILFHVQFICAEVVSLIFPLLISCFKNGL
jgi:hypothetical protein